MFYAIHHWYGLRTLSSADRLYRYATKEERDEAVENDPYDGSNYRLESVTRKRAQSDFPNAFKIIDMPNIDESWEDDVWGAGPTSGRYAYVG